MRPPRFTCVLAAFMTITPYTPQQFHALAKSQMAVAEKISILKRLTAAFPLDSRAHEAHEEMVNLLLSTNRYEEALQEYRKDHPDTGAGRAIDFKLLELLLRTGRYTELLRDAARAAGPERDLLRDMKLLELQVQALLAKGRYAMARRCVDTWLAAYRSEVAPGSRFESDLRSIQYLARHLANLERMQGTEGKALFTAAVPDSLQHWSKQQNVPIYFFKLIPTHLAGELPAPLLPGRHEGADYFADRVADLNHGFDYVSGGQFSLHFAGMHTLYVSEGDLDPESSGGHLLTSRVYVHTIPQLYRLAGEAYVVLIDYRVPAEGEAAYMGDGLIHLSANKFKTLVLMHEILHGLGATHQEWNGLEAKGYRFDPEDRGLMTFDHGEILDLGLEEKNRALLGWPQVGVVRPRFNSDAPPQETTTALAPKTAAPASSGEVPSL